MFKLSSSLQKNSYKCSFSSYSYCTMSLKWMSSATSSSYAGVFVYEHLVVGGVIIVLLLHYFSAASLPAVSLCCWCFVQHDWPCPNCLMVDACFPSHYVFLCKETSNYLADVGATKASNCSFVVVSGAVYPGAHLLWRFRSLSLEWEGKAAL